MASSNGDGNLTKEEDDVSGTKTEDDLSETKETTESQTEDDLSETKETTESQTENAEERQEDKTENKTTNAESSNAKDKSDPESVWFREFLARSLGLRPPPDKVLDTVDLDGIIKLIKDGKVKNIITMAGAGISTSAGIPDFRSPGTGLYDNLQKYNLPHPQAIFSLDYFHENPEPFFILAKELYPGVFKPTPCHYFLKMLEDKGLLLRHYTQNIDTLESVAGLSPEKMVEAHGSFRTGHCLKCKKEFTQEWMKDEIFADRVPKCTEAECDGVVKPDIVFFGEALPARFRECLQMDFSVCDLLIILGTSLVVQPFASLTSRVSDSCPRLYINMEKTGSNPNAHPMSIMMFGGGFKFDAEDNIRDIFVESSCDDGCMKLADGLGWGEELTALVKREHEKIDSVKTSAKI